MWFGRHAPRAVIASGVEILLFVDFIIILLKFRKKETEHLKKPDGKNLYRPILNCMIVLAVLSGLFFSNAEGIRLLPFPDCTAADVVNSGTGNSVICGSNHSPAIRKSNSRHSANVKAKNFQRHDANAAAALPERVALETKWSVVPEQVSSFGLPPIFSHFVGLQTGRGPPFA